MRFFLIALAWLFFCAPVFAQVGQIPGWPPIQIGTPWTPASLPGLIGWYKADVGVFTDTSCSTPAANTNTVACWSDQSGHGNNLLQATAGKRPTFQSAGLDSKQTLFFTAASTTCLTSASGVAMGTGVAMSVFAIGQMQTGVISFGQIAGYAPPSAASNANGGMLLARNSTNSQIYSQKGASFFSGPAAISLSTTTRLGGWADGTTNVTYVNGSPTTVGATNGSNAFISAGYISIGSSIGSGGTTGVSAWQGPVSEVIITNTALSTSDIANLDAYLAARW